MGVGLFHIYWFQLFMSTQGPSKSWGVDTPNRCTYTGYSLHTHPVCLDWGPGGVNPQSLNSTGLVRPDGCENRGNTIHRRVACTRQGGASHSSESDTGYTVQYIFMSDQIQNVNSNQMLTGKPVQGPPQTCPRGAGGHCKILKSLFFQNFENVEVSQKTYLEEFFFGFLERIQGVVGCSTHFAVRGGFRPEMKGDFSQNPGTFTILAAAISNKKERMS